MTVSSAGVEDSAPILSRERIIAKPGFNRWLVPPGRACHPSLHRHGIRLLGVLAAALGARGVRRAQQVAART